MTDLGLSIICRTAKQSECFFVRSVVSDIVRIDGRWYWMQGRHENGVGTCNPGVEGSPPLYLNYICGRTMMRPYHLLTSFLVCIIIPKADLIQTHSVEHYHKDGR